MHDSSKIARDCSAQPSSQTRRVSPTNPFIEFHNEEIEQSISDRFEQQVARYPDRIAIKTGSCTLTYDALNKAANQVAWAILAKQGKANEPVALLFEHHVPMITAILGALKAGKISVPLDPSFPTPRIALMLENSQAGLIVGNNHHSSLLDQLAGAERRALYVDELSSSFSDENPGLSIAPQTIASIMYTSGSTGQPKGVTQSHHNILQKVMSHTNDFHISLDDRLSLLYSCGFSASVRNIFGALLNGAALFPFDLHKEGLDPLAKWLMRENISMYFSVPTLFRRFVGTLDESERISSVRLIYLGSEGVTKEDVELFKKHFSAECILVNSLASNETGTARQYFIDKDTEIEGSTVPVGYEVRDKEVLLLDEEGKKVGFNQMGEIAVRSRFLSPGYWRKPDLTQTKFLADPNGGDERIYLTGDLGLMLPDGCLLHMGRKDFQVKVRGIKIEVGEIESILLALEQVKEVAVVASEGQGEEKRLIAYVVAAANCQPTVSVLRRALREKLPDYMIPSAFVLLEALPLTPTGKLDRRALPDPGRSRPELETPLVLPRTEVERKLARIWAEAFGLEEVGIHDDFFELGGDSLLATQLVSRVCTALEVELPQTCVFEEPTVAELATRITQAQG
ncbi:MAG TPA: AMP-binding protein [Candidatus Binatia bacterium]|jgi:amino acid adenylation domain-containing protein|nr:AMP-binding protein [Candidatus Binatia bacterium]